MNKFLDMTGLTYFWGKIKAYVTTAIAGKVDVVEGKGLSTNDFTDADKTKLDNLGDMTAITNTEIDTIVNS